MFAAFLAATINTLQRQCRGNLMKLEEIDGSDAATLRVKALKDEAKRAKDKAAQVKAKADTAAVTLAVQKATKLATVARQPAAVPPTA